MCRSVQPEQSRSSSCFAVGYLEGFSPICARRLVLNRTKMEKLVLTSIIFPSPPQPQPAGLASDHPQPEIRLIIYLFFFFLEKGKFCSWV